MLTPVPMLKAEVCVHRDYVDAVLYSLGTQGLFEIEDIRPRLERDKGLKGRVQPIEPAPGLFQLSSLSSRTTALTAMLGIPEDREAARVSEESLDDAKMKEISSLLDRLQEQVQTLQTKITELQQAEEKTPETESQLSAAREELRRIADGEGRRLLTYRAILEPRLRLENAKTRMGRTDATVVIQGWLPTERAEAFKAVVERASEGNCFIALSAPKVGHDRHGREAEELEERPPTLLSAPRIAGAYQKLVTAFGIPNYFELDPSVLWLFTFPVVFGLMFGDLGQGMVLAALALVGFLLKRRGVKGGELATYILEGTPIFVMCGIAAALIGFLYGEFFGLHLSAHGEGVYLPGLVEAREGLLEFLDRSLRSLRLYFPPDFHPLKYPTVLLKTAIYMAVVHISLGLILSLINKVRSREYMEAFAGPVTWLWLYLGGAYLFVTYGGGVFAVLFTNMEVALTFVFLPFIVMLVARMKAEGVEGLGEALDALIASLSNTISYARVFAFAMIHAVLNGIFTTVGYEVGIPAVGALSGTFFFVFFEIVFVFFQTLRLHWVEFGLKFFSGDGTAFKPFSTAGPA